MKRHIIIPAAAAFVIAFSIAFVACGSDDDGNDPPSAPSDEYTSECDEFGNRVYITEDDDAATPGIFVLKDDCDPGVEGSG